MAEASPLRELAGRHGIALGYFDIWGREHRASDAALAAILAAMGVRARTDAEAEAELRAEEVRRWRRLLPAAVVARVDRGPTRLRLNLPAALDVERLAWRLEEESGAVHAGEFAAGTLPAIERTTVDGVAYAARELELGAAPAPGYHRLRILRGAESLGETELVIAPGACYRPLALDGDGRVWGPAVQLYAVRSERNWGIGDFTDLRTIVEQWGGRGAGIVGVNPLHALFPHNPEHVSPYSPSSRLFLNTLYLDVEAMEDFRECEEVHTTVRSAAFQARLKALRDAELVDYAGVAEAKAETLARLYTHFRTRHLAAGSPRGRAFREFQARGGEPLRRHALFEALQERFHRDDPSVWGWPAWPDAFRDPQSAAVAEFAAAHAERVEFYEYLQWQADLQLERIGRRAAELGLGVGLYVDLAVSIDRGGAEAWANQALYAASASVGAPPDDFNQKGQDWGLPPFVPDRLREAAYAPFVATLRASMRHAGALRIDHAMGLMRLFWVPPETEAVGGTYVHYPFDDLLGILALESHRNRCLVIGEDLGTVPDEVRHAFAEFGVLSYRVLLFERTGSGDFKPPAEYPSHALITATTHDLPTLAGWWEGRDVELRHELALVSAEEARRALVVERARDLARLLLALEREQLLPPGVTVNPVSVPKMTPEFMRAVHAYLARSPAQVLVVQLEDVLAARDQVNLPATAGDRYPNWRRKLALALERWPEDDRFVELTNALVRIRGRARPARPGRAGPAAATIPRATYRLQLHRDFAFADATALVPYLAALGVSHVYCSPYLRARPGSRHGYDIIDHGALNPEIGDRDDFERFVAALQAHGMGQILDMVPNHMGVMGADNAWWIDVLENGPASIYAGYFDIDWWPLDPALAGKVLLPVLGEHYGNVLERGELKLGYEAATGAFAVRYFEHCFPLDPREYPRILERAAKLAGPAALPTDGAAELESLIAAFRHLPTRSATAPQALAERGRDKELLKGRLAGLGAAYPALAEAIERAVHVINGTPDERASFAALDELLEAQAYRLAYWRVAADEINYRRFFDINELAALRMENEAAFEATHRFALELAAEGKIEGLRIDHPDGLYDPGRYFRRLQDRYGQLAGVDAAALAGERPRPLYVVVEKIVAPHEHLPETWPVHGTTGYRFANVVNGLLVDTEARARVDRVWRAFVGSEALDFEEAAYLGKRLIMRSALAGELTVLATQLLRIARADRRTRDFTQNTLRQVLEEVVACFPVYRTYVAERVSPQDRRYIDWAIGRAKRRARSADASVFDFVKSALLARAPEGASAEFAAAYRAFAMRFQQFTAPVTAKGVEDTSFYVFNRLVSLNDVGGDPDAFGMTVSAFHGASLDRAAKWPHTLLATSTHDNKRSEDVRARIDVISEMPAAWRLAVRRWSRINRSKKRAIDGEAAPSRNDEYLLYQTLAGSFPTGDLDAPQLDAYRERVEAYMLKAAREAKVRTSWINPHEEYEGAVARFVRALLGRLEGNLFLDDFRAQLPAFSWFGALNSVSMALVKFTSPGVPDLYQGNELADYSLVDPDNRRPVDYAARRAALDSLTGLAHDPAEGLAARVRALVEAPYDGRAKLWVIWRALALRRDRPDLFAEGDYYPVAAAGARARHLVAYARRLGPSGIVAVAGRLFASLGLPAGTPPLGETAWGDTAVDLSWLPAGVALRNALTGESHAAGDALPVARIFANFPGAALVYQAPPP
jgi:(1->4)-alpha-D-glucan 1-alpha-D-glucosylmutase